jgi:hypothetical protein
MSVVAPHIVAPIQQKPQPLVRLVHFDIELFLLRGKHYFTYW